MRRDGARAASARPASELLVQTPPPEAEQARIERITEGWTARQLRRRDLDEEHSGIALDLRELVAARVDAEELARLDHRRSRLPVSPAYACEFWFARLREIDQAAAAAQCEHDHTEMGRWHDRCPRCWSPLEQAPRRSAPRQLSLAEVSR